MLFLVLARELEKGAEFGGREDTLQRRRRLLHNGDVGGRAQATLEQNVTHNSTVQILQLFATSRTRLADFVDAAGQT